MRLGLAQINPTVGDLSGNRDLILNAYRELVDAGAQLVVFPELATCGYLPDDCLLQPRFGDENEGVLLEIAAATGNVPALVGTLETSPGQRGRPFRNAAAWCQHGAIQGFARKQHLSPHDFNAETRYFEPGDHLSTFPFAGSHIAVAIGDDLNAIVSRPRTTAPISPVSPPPDLLVNLSASTWRVDQSAASDDLVTRSAAQLGYPVVSVRAVGTHDGIRHGGRSEVVLPSGEHLAKLPGAAPAHTIVDLSVPTASSTRILPLPTEIQNHSN